MNASDLYDQVMEKVAKSNPAAPVKSSLGDGPIDMGLNAPYMNSGGKAGAQGPSSSVSSPSANYVNVRGGQSAGQQPSGPTNVHASPDTGDLGSTGGDMTMSKNAAFEAGVMAVLSDVAYGND